MPADAFGAQLFGAVMSALAQLSQLACQSDNFREF
jgi:hypothetical protein